MKIKTQDLTGGDVINDLHDTIDRREAVKWPDCVEKARAFLDAARKQGEKQ